VLLVVRISTYAIFRFFFFDREASARQEKENIGTSDEERRSTFSSFVQNVAKHEEDFMALWWGSCAARDYYTPTGGGETSVRVRERE